MFVIKKKTCKIQTYGSKSLASCPEPFEPFILGWLSGQKLSGKPKKNMLYYVTLKITLLVF
jgi:hypothetical protein